MISLLVIQHLERNSTELTNCKTQYLVSVETVPQHQKTVSVTPFSSQMRFLAIIHHSKKQAVLALTDYWRLYQQ